MILNPELTCTIKSFKLHIDRLALQAFEKAECSGRSDPHNCRSHLEQRWQVLRDQPGAGLKRYIPNLFLPLPSKLASHRYDRSLLSNSDCRAAKCIDLRLHPAVKVMRCVLLH